MKTYKAKGGEFRYSLENVVNNDTFVVPAGCKIDGIVSRLYGDTTDGLTLSIGTTDNGGQIVSAEALSAGLGAVVVDLGVFSTTEDQTCYITTEDQAADEYLDLYVQMSRFLLVK
jgi:hypothetical protein